MQAVPPDTLHFTFSGYFSKVMCLREMSKQRTSLNLTKSHNLLHLKKEHVSCI